MEWKLCVDAMTKRPRDYTSQRARTPDVRIGMGRRGCGEDNAPTRLFFTIDLNAAFVIIYPCCASSRQSEGQGREHMATKSNFILKVQDAKLADVQKALKDANITVVSIMEIHKEEA